jgi:hypothetical protein
MIDSLGRQSQGSEQLLCSMQSREVQPVLIQIRLDSESHKYLLPIIIIFQNICAQFLTAAWKSKCNHKQRKALKGSDIEIISVRLS